MRRLVSCCLRGAEIIRQRQEGWEGRLATVLREARERQFDARKWNCGRFALACAEAVAGRSIPAVWKGSLEASADASLKRIPPRTALRGDVVLARVPEVSLGVCVGSKAVFVGKDGLMEIPMRRVAVAWRV